MHIYFINFIINILKFFYLPIILPIRTYIREYVYNYLIKNKIIFLFPYDLKITNLSTYTINNNHVFLKYRKTNKYLFYTYYWLFWIWYDDETYDNINLIKLYELCYKYKWLDKLLKKDLEQVNKQIDKISFHNLYNDFNPSKYTLLLYISIFYNNNNYYNLNFYSKVNNKIYTIFTVKNYHYLYKAKEL